MASKPNSGQQVPPGGSGIGGFGVEQTPYGGGGSAVMEQAPYGGQQAPYGGQQAPYGGAGMEQTPYERSRQELGAAQSSRYGRQSRVAGDGNPLFGAQPSNQLFGLPSGYDQLPITSRTVTLVRNLTNHTLTTPFLNPYKSELVAGETVAINGDLLSFGRYGPSQRRWHADSIIAALAAGYISLSTGQRFVTYLEAASATVLAIGDFCYYNAGQVKPAADFTWDTNLATTQAAFDDLFLGRSLVAKASGATVNSIAIDISPDLIHTINCASESHVIGDKMALAKNASLDKLENQKLVKVSSAEIAYAQRYDTDGATTSVPVKLKSAYYKP